MIPGRQMGRPISAFRAAAAKAGIPSEVINKLLDAFEEMDKEDEEC